MKILFNWNKKSFLHLFNFGYKLLLAGLLNTTFDHIYKLVIGKFFMAATLGFYTQAQRLQQLAGQTLVEIIQKVTYPLLSKTGGDKNRLKNGYRKVIQGSSFLIFPAMILLIVLANPIMRFILGEQWIPAAPFLQLLCLSGMLYHLHAINLNILKVVGRTDLFLKLEIIKKLNIALAIFIGLQYGIYGLLIGQVISSYIALGINTFYTSKFLDYSLLEQAHDVFGVLILSAPMALCVTAVSLVLPVKSLFLLLVYILISILVYVFTNILYRTKVSEIVLSFIEPFLSLRLKKILHV